MIPPEYAPKLGDIILLNRKGKSSSIYSAAQRFFTKMPYTHTTVAMGNVLGFPSALSAEELVVVEPIQRYFEEEGTEIEIYRIHNLKLNVASDVISYLYFKESGAYYGFTQILWFIYRWFMESVFQKDVRKERNPMSKGIICSEPVYNYLVKMVSMDPDLCVTPLNSKLTEWNANTVNAGDIATICKSFPEIFSQIYTNKS